MSVLLVMSGTSCSFTFVFPGSCALHGSTCILNVRVFLTSFLEPIHNTPVLLPSTLLMLTNKEHSNKLFSLVLSSHPSDF